MNLNYWHVQYSDCFLHYVKTYVRIVGKRKMNFRLCAVFSFMIPRLFKSAVTPRAINASYFSQCTLFKGSVEIRSTVTRLSVSYN